jgi:hypothetical protein
MPRTYIESAGGMELIGEEIDDVAKTGSVESEHLGVSALLARNSLVFLVLDVQVPG